MDGVATFTTKRRRVPAEANNNMTAWLQSVACAFHPHEEMLEINYILDSTNYLHGLCKHRLVLWVSAWGDTTGSQCGNKFIFQFSFKLLSATFESTEITYFLHCILTGIVIGYLDKGVKDYGR